MPTYSFTRRINAPIDRVFAIFADLRNAEHNVRAIKRLEVLTDGPIRAGTRFRETRTMFRRDATETMEVKTFSPPNSYSVGCFACGAEWLSEFRFSPAGDGATRLDVEMRCRPMSLMARLMTPFSFLMAGAMKKCIEADLDDLQAIAEGKTPAGAAAAGA